MMVEHFNIKKARFRIMSNEEGNGICTLYGRWAVLWKPTVKNELQAYVNI